MSGEGHEKAEKFIKRLLASVKQIGGKGGIAYQTIVDTVRDDPESAAEIVLAYCRQETLDATRAQIAMTIADAYEYVLGDDSLVNEVSRAPWFSTARPPDIVEPDGTPIQLRDPLLPDEGGGRIIQVAAVDLRTGSVERFVKRLGTGGRDVEEVRKLSTLWGMCRLRFDLPADDPLIWKIPEVRRLIANLHEAMPYFPCYLNFRRELLMFAVYFGTLADPEAFSDGNLNLQHESVFDRVMESIAAIDDVARIIQTDPRPVWRTVLSLYPRDRTDRLLKALYESLYG